MKGILAFDLGTSSVKCSVFSEEGVSLASCVRDYKTFFPGEDMREQRPSDWIDGIICVTKELSEKGFMGCEIAAIGISGHSLGAVPVDKDGDCLVEATPIWSDARATAQAERFFEKIDYQSWYEKTGNGFTPQLYSIFKIMWLKEHRPEVYEKTYKFLGTKDYANLFLCGEFATDRSYASGCGLYDLANSGYIKEYADAAQIDIEKLPRIAESNEIIGYVGEEAAKLLGIAVGIPVVAGGVDNACMTLGADCYREGDSYASLGSSAWVTLTTEQPLTDFKAKIYTFEHCVKGMYLPSVGIYSSGSALQWAAERFFADLEENSRFKNIDELAEKSPAGANGLLFYPCLAGGSGFDASPDVRGCFYGLSLEHTREDIARALLEGIAMHLKLADKALDCPKGEEILLVGGGAKSKVWRRIYADVFGRSAVSTKVARDAASLGAAALAATGCGLWKDYSIISKLHGEGERLEPSAENKDIYNKLLDRFEKLAKLCGEMAAQ